MSDLVVLMHQGGIAQTGAPRELYTDPANVFVADFIGDSNLLAGKVIESSGDVLTIALDAGTNVTARRRGNAPFTSGARVTLVVRPEEISVRKPGETADVRPRLSGTVAEIGYQGDSYRLGVVAGGETVKARVSPHIAHLFKLGATVELSWDRDTACVLGSGDEAAAAGRP
jgi:ABC-type Fe3+/spermidine/putrescine transport system ATPase subunit